MKILTVKQPWASLIVHGIKNIENRTWKTSFRGRILIHASKNGVKDGWRALSQDQIREASNKGLIGYKYDELPSSAIIGSVEIVGCVVNHPSIWAEKTPNYVSRLSPRIHENVTGEKVIYNWVLANPIMFSKPIPMKGKLGLWECSNIHSELDEDGNDVCHCNLGIDEKDQVISFGNGDYRCKYCGGKWYK